MNRHDRGIAARGLAMAACAFAFGAFAQADTIIVSRADVEFPREAVQAGAEKGRVRARLTIDKAGEVTRVDIVEAHPRRVFDRAATKSLSQWRFNPGSDGRQYEIDIDFKR